MSSSRAPRGREDSDYTYTFFRKPACVRLLLVLCLAACAGAVVLSLTGCATAAAPSEKPVAEEVEAPDIDEMIEKEREAAEAEGEGTETAEDADESAGEAGKRGEAGETGDAGAAEGTGTAETRA